MSETIKEWRERTRPARQAKCKARNQALKDLKHFGIMFDFLRPCPTDFDGTGEGWERSRTTWNLFTDSIEAFYARSIGPGLSERAIQLKTGDFYYLRTYKNKQYGMDSRE